MQFIAFKRHKNSSELTEFKQSTGYCVVFFFLSQFTRYSYMGIARFALVRLFEEIRNESCGWLSQHIHEQHQKRILLETHIGERNTSVIILTNVSFYHSNHSGVEAIFSRFYTARHCSFSVCWLRKTHITHTLTYSIRIDTRSREQPSHIT